jgi:predicted amidohydrolase YtcJ
MKIAIENEEAFLRKLFKQLPEPAPEGGKITCYWSATYGAFTFAAYVTQTDGSVELLDNTEAAGNFIYRDWVSRHQTDVIDSYDEWLRQRHELEPLSWNWGWATGGVEGFTLQVFDDVMSDEGLPPQDHVDAWLTQRFGNLTIKYPSDCV